MIYFIHNGKCRTLPCASLASMGQELKVFLNRRNPDIRGFIPSGALKWKFSYWLDFTGAAEPFQIFAIVRTRKGYRIASASFAPNGDFQGYRIPLEAPGVKETVLGWEGMLKSAYHNPKQKFKAVRASKLLKGL